MLINPYWFTPPYDTDAQTYITAVETADGQSLETGVKDAINAFVVGCKTDGIWTAIKASCILAGARTLNGALVPLVGAAPTNNNFAAGDYNRKTGLTGSSKNFNSNRSNASDPQNSNHNCIYTTSTLTATAVAYNCPGSGSFVSGFNAIAMYNDNRIYFHSRSTIDGNLAQTGTTGFVGMSRSASASFIARRNGANTTFNVTSSAPSTGNLVFTVNPNMSLAFYSIGESLNLALLDSRVTTLINALAAAIP